jgi:hypothetical protein
MSTTNLDSPPGGVWWVFGPEGQLNVQNTRDGSIGLNTQVAAFPSANTNTPQTMFTFAALLQHVVW